LALKIIQFEFGQPIAYISMEDIYFELRCLFPKSVVENIIQHYKCNHVYGKGLLCKICQTKLICGLAIWSGPGTAGKALDHFSDLQLNIKLLYHHKATQVDYYSKWNDNNNHAWEIYAKQHYDELAEK
jgi:hypothetical protein